MPADGESPLPNPGVTYDVKRHFGAKGDGVADDTVSLQRAFDVLGRTGGVLYLPPGTYKLNEMLYVKRPNVIIRGAGVS